MPIVPVRPLAHDERITVSQRSSSRVIASLARGDHRRMLALSAATFEAYAGRFGWDLVLSTESLAPERPGSWAKIPLLQELLRSYELVWWIDADAVIVDLERDIAATVHPGADVYFVAHAQQRDELAVVPNAGVMLVRRSPFAAAFLEAVWASEQHIDHNWWENAAVIELLGQSLVPPFPVTDPTSRWRERIDLLDLCWNSVPGYHESPSPVVNHHARADHDDFGRRLAAVLYDVLDTAERFPEAFN
jgi:glycosyl transferase family (putative galactosyltransferase)